MSLVHFLLVVLLSVFPLNCFPSLLQGIHKEEVLLLQLLQQHLELLQQHLELLQQHLELLLVLAEVVEVVLAEVLEEGLVVEEDLEEHLLVLNLLLGEVLILQGLSLPQGNMVPQLLVLLLHQLMAHTLDG